MKGYVHTATFQPITYYTAVLSATLPSTADENILCFVGEGSIGKVCVNCSALPETGNENDICVLTGDIPFSTSRWVSASLGQAYHYDGTQWQEISGYLRQNGSWIQFSSAE